MSTFYTYRILMNVSVFPSLFPDEFVKEDLFQKVFTTLIEKRKAEFEHWSVSHVIYPYKRLGNDVFVWQLAKKQRYEKPIAGEDRIEKVEDTKYPFIYLVFHATRQIVLVEYNSSVFPDLDSVKGKLEKYFTANIYPARVTVHLKEMTDPREFWARVEEMDIVQDVTLEFNPPNLWGGEKEVDRLVKNAHEETNFDKFKMIFQNKVEGLIFTVKNFGEQIARLASGGGEYVVKGKKNGVDYQLSSTEKPLKTNIHDLDGLTENEAEEKFKNIDETSRDEQK